MTNCEYAGVYGKSLLVKYELNIGNNQYALVPIHNCDNLCLFCHDYGKCIKCNNNIIFDTSGTICLNGSTANITSKMIHPEYEDEIWIFGVHESVTTNFCSATDNSSPILLPNPQPIN